MPKEKTRDEATSEQHREMLIAYHDLNKCLNAENYTQSWNHRPMAQVSWKIAIAVCSPGSAYNRTFPYNRASISESLLLGHRATLQ